MQAPSLIAWRPVLAARLLTGPVVGAEFHSTLFQMQYGWTLYSRFHSIHLILMNLLQSPLGLKSARIRGVNLAQ